MGLVSEVLRELIERQLHERRLVVWFDPERHYGDFSAALAFPDTTIMRYEGSFFQLRHDLSPLLEGEEPPRLLVYVPCGEDDTQQALIELTAAGVVLKPGQQPRTRNTRLSVIARAALAESMSTEQVQQIEKQITEGRLSLADLDRIAETASGKDAHGVIAILFGTNNPEEVALALLSNDGYDAQVAAKRVQADIAELLGVTYGVVLSPDGTLNDLKVRLARHVLCTDLLASLHPPLPAQLATVKVASGTAARDACVHLARRWRQARDLSDSYATYADRVEHELALGTVTFTPDQVRDCETFEAIEHAAATTLETRLMNAPSHDLVTFIEQRQLGYWTQRVPEMQARWALVATIAQLFLRANDIAPALRQHDLTAADLFHRYTAGEHPWCELDTLYRQLEHQMRYFPLMSGNETLNQLVAVARQRYMDVGDQLATRFTTMYAKAGFAVAGVLQQRHVYDRTVRSALREGKTGYILVDALRFEMARDLVRTLSAEHGVTLDAGLGTVPSITEIGMAALLPGAEVSATVVAAGQGKVGLMLGDTILRDRTGRLDWLKTHAGVNAAGQPANVYDVTLDDLLRLRPDVERQARTADLVVVTSGEIDALAEKDNISLAWAFMDHLLSHLSRGIRRLIDLGCRRIIFAADHGYLFGEELESDMKLDPPGGRTVDLHRRVWVGTGGAQSDAYLNVRLAEFGLSDDEHGDLEIAVPRGFGAFRVPGGARAYFHGGMSLQELAIPIATLVPVASQGPSAAEQDIAWALTPGSRKITSHFCSITITGQRRSLFDIAAPAVRLELHAAGEVISQAVAATYGFSDTTGAVQMAFDEGASGTLQPNTVTLALTRDDLPNQYVSAHLLDALTNRELKHVEGLEVTRTLFTL